MIESGQRGRASVVGALLHRAQERPDAIAYSEPYEKRVLSWRQLHDAAGAFAARLVEQGARARVLVSAPNVLELPVALFGGLWAGADVAAVTPELPPGQLDELLHQLRPATVIGDANTLERARAAGCPDRLPVARVLDGHATSPPAADAEFEGSLLLLTSGTTGKPRLVRRRAAALAAVGASCATAIDVRASDRILLSIPLHHSYGIDQGVLTAAFAGCSVDLHDGFVLSRVRASLRKGATILPAVPFLFDVLARAGAETVQPGGLRLAISAGGPLPIAVFQDFRAATGISIGQIYGATEFGSVTWSDPASNDFSPQSVGRPLPGVAIRIVAADDDHAIDSLAPGEEGRVAVATPSLFEGYVGEEAVVAPDGFFRTSDLGRFDAAGNLHLTGRTSLLVDVGGRKVNPIEVELALETHPLVSAAVVVPTAHSRTVTRLKALVVPAGSEAPTAAELRSHLEERVAAYKIPRSFEIRASLPRSPTGKVLRAELLAESAAGHAQSADP